MPDRVARAPYRPQGCHHRARAGCRSATPAHTPKWDGRTDQQEAAEPLPSTWAVRAWVRFGVLVGIRRYCPPALPPPVQSLTRLHRHLPWPWPVRQDGRTPAWISQLFTGYWVVAGLPAVPNRVKFLATGGALLETQVVIDPDTESWESR